MKKIFITVFVAMGLIACSNATKPAEQEATENVEAVDMAHTSQNSLDYYGTYSGTLPCADCEGMKTEIKLDAGNNYTMKTVYVGKDATVYEATGVYSWDKTGQIITLAGITDAPCKYIVGENLLKQLDMEGNEITGDLADMYILRK
jgi:uncharacterized lipoprotein NlpE involved in copper resistance